MLTKMSSRLNLKNLKNKNIHIVGISGAEGSAIAEFLVGNNISSITGYDFSLRKDFKDAFYKTHLSLKSDEREKALQHLLNLPIKINFKDHYLEGIEEADLVFVSQVWFKYPQNMPILQDLRNSGTPFKTITNLYFEFAPCKIISITGTNGKTTTARLINNIFENWIDSGVHSLECKNIILNFVYRLKPELQSKIYFAGNDRQNIQVLDKLNEMSENDVLILETSSTQLLLNSGVSPHIGIITNITPNHLDDHGSFENYLEAKKNLIKYQNKEDFAVLNYDDDVVRKIAEKHNKSKAFLFSGEKELEEGCFIRNEKIIIKFNKKELVICDISDIKIPGKHNLENVLAAVSAAYLYGVDLKSIKKGVTEYTGIKHRLKLLYNINEIKYYDDTQATTPEATIAGIESFNNDIILLAGGDDKGMNYENLARKINKEAKLLVLFPGSASDKIEKLIDESKVDFIKVEDFSEAINVLKDYYKKAAILKDTAVLISPAAAHFYSKFVEDSGRDLREWVRLLG